MGEEEVEKVYPLKERRERLRGSGFGVVVVVEITLRAVAVAVAAVLENMGEERRGGTPGERRHGRMTQMLIEVLIDVINLAYN